MLNEFTIRHPATKYALLSLEKNLAGHVFPWQIQFLPVSSAVNL